MKLFTYLLAITLITGCATTGAPTMDLASRYPAPNLAAIAPVPNDGAIYREASGGLALFQDLKARQAGDLLTIQLVENTTASSNASTSTSKDSAISAAAPSVLGAPITLNGRSVLGAEASSGHSFSGTGKSAQSNSLVGNVTVTVIQRLANGNLVIRGDKHLRLNQADEVVQIQGIVRTADISPDNTVVSSRVADVTIVYAGRGAVAKSNVMGWLSRFFQSPIFPI